MIEHMTPRTADFVRAIFTKTMAKIVHNVWFGTYAKLSRCDKGA